MVNYRKEIIDSTIALGEGHLGGCFSCIDILDVLYNKVITDNDIFILSKGHAYHSLYVILKHKGLNPVLSGHPDIDTENGIYCTGGSLGHGLPIGVGVALSKKLKREEGKVYVLMSDGECQEGTTWESMMLASYHKLDNLVIIIDNNHLQALDIIDNVTDNENLVDKFRIFGGNVFYLKDGHNSNGIRRTLVTDSFEQPVVIIANTIKGKGISFMESNVSWHARIPTEKEYELMMEELL